MTSQQIQRELDKKVTMSIFDHELNRFYFMDIEQLTERLWKITNPVKLEAFRQAALQFKLRKLARLAREKRDFMYN